MISYDHFFNAISNTKLKALTQTLPGLCQMGLCTKRYGDLPSWYHALNALPDITPSIIDLKNSVTVGKASDASTEQLSQLDNVLRKLIPWRKGPFNIFDIAINTEWRSDWKWDRVLPHLSPLKDKTILDVGCGNGYHCLRMAGEGAKRAVGIDPSPRFVVQFYMLKKYLADISVDVLPVGIEALPVNLGAFDTTFSMGVLYHRRSPLDHLRELKDTLRPGGELVLETLVIDGPLGATLVPEGRYAMMNNVWFLPSLLTLESWMRKVGFEAVKTVDKNTTTTDEQRATDWMQFQSLSDFLAPEDPSKTAEGHPAPKRAVILAKKPHT